MLPCAVAVSVCGVGAAPPKTALNEKAEGLKVIVLVVAVVTVKVTGTVLAPLAAFTKIMPLQTVPPAIPD